MNIEQGTDKALSAISLLETRMVSKINGDRYWKGHAGLSYVSFMGQGIYRLPKPNADVQTCDLLFNQLGYGSRQRIQQPAVFWRVFFSSVI